MHPYRTVVFCESNGLQNEVYLSPMTQTAFICALIGLSLSSGQTISNRSKRIGDAADEAAIRAIVNHWQHAWEKFDASVVRGDYADDADWINAFGVTRSGADKIVAQMATFLKNPAVQGRHTQWDEPRIRFLRSDVALAHRDYKTVGQKTLDGVAMPQRITHATWFLTKENGKWLIASQVISDDKDI